MGSHRVGHDWSDLAAAAERPETAHFTLWGSVSSIRRLKCYWLQLGHWIAWVNIWKFPEQCPAHEKLSINDNCIYGHIQLIHFIVQQKLAPYCKATTPQFKKKKKEKLVTVLFEANSVLCLKGSMVHSLQSPSPRGIQAHSVGTSVLQRWLSASEANGSQGQLWKRRGRWHHSPPASWSRRVFKAWCSLTTGTLRINSISFRESVSWAH